MELQINQKFKELIPPLEQNEYFKLQSSLMDEGCREALITWNGVIVDGHTRYEICKNFNIPFKTVEKSFENEDAAVEWIMFNQLARRNLNDVQRGRIALKLKESIAARAKEKQYQGTNQYSLSADLPEASEPIDTRKELAKIAGIGERTLSKIEKVDKEAPAPIREAMGKSISIDKAAKLNTALKDTPEAERDNEAKRLLAEGLAEKAEPLSDEEKMVKALSIMISAATVGSGYITEDCVDVYIKRTSAIVTDVAANIDGEIAWLLKLKELFLKRNTVSVDTITDDSHNAEIANEDAATEDGENDDPATEDGADDDFESEDANNSADDDNDDDPPYDDEN